MNMKLAKPLCPPPNVTPPYCRGLKGTGSQFVDQHVRHFVYIWMVSEQAFWMYPIQMSGIFVYGYIWRNTRWMFVRIPKMEIDSLY